MPQINKGIKKSANPDLQLFEWGFWMEEFLGAGIWLLAV